MCLPDFKRFEQVSEDNPIIGYRSWRNLIKDNENLDLNSESQNYIWTPSEGPHEVLKSNSGLYAYNNNYHNNNYNNYNNNYYNYYNNYNYNYNNNYYNCNYYSNYYNYNYNYNYYLGGIIIQFGKVAIHEIGQRSEYAKIKTLFTIRETDAKGSEEFLGWIKIFNSKIEKIVQKYNANTINWQDFKESQK